jgi:hypothetical protein
MKIRGSKTFGVNMLNRVIHIEKAFVINAPAETIFPLICPFGEYKWIPGWNFELVHCPNERIEQGTIFREVSPPPILMGSFFGKTTWTAVLHDPIRQSRLRNVKSGCNVLAAEI